MNPGLAQIPMWREYSDVERVILAIQSSGHEGKNSDELKHMLNWSTKRTKSLANEISNQLQWKVMREGQNRSSSLRYFDVHKMKEGPSHNPMEKIHGKEMTTGPPMAYQTKQSSKLKSENIVKSCKKRKISTNSSKTNKCTKSATANQAGTTYDAPKQHDITSGIVEIATHLIELLHFIDLKTSNDHSHVKSSDTECTKVPKRLHHLDFEWTSEMGISPDAQTKIDLITATDWLQSKGFLKVKHDHVSIELT